MYRMMRFRRLAGSVLSLAWLQFVLVPAASLAAPVKIPAGQIVELAFANTLTPLNAVVGQTITLNVVEDVLVGGRVVIEKGTLARGEVVRSRKRGSVGKAAEIEVVLRSVTAVDGTIVPLTGQKSVIGEEKTGSSIAVTILCCVLGLLMKGGEAEIPAGSTVRGTVAGSVTVEL